MPRQHIVAARRGIAFIVGGWLLGAAFILSVVFLATGAGSLNIHNPSTFLFLGSPFVLFAANLVWLALSFGKRTTAKQWPPDEQRVLAFTRVGIAILTGTPLALWVAAMLIAKGDG